MKNILTWDINSIEKTFILACFSDPKRIAVELIATHCLYSSRSAQNIKGEAERLNRVRILSSLMDKYPQYVHI